MPLTYDTKINLDKLKREYDSLKPGKESLLDIIFDSELAESVYNSNAIENSTLTIAETENILMELQVSRNISVREVFEAKNLARVSEYIKKKAGEEELGEDLVLLLHRMLIENIDEEIAGRFRRKNEYVRVGMHIAPAPEHVESMINGALLEYSSNHSDHFLETIAKFHLEFEHVHPFIDGNGKIGRVLINFQLMKIGFPPVIIRDKEKAGYYTCFKEYAADGKTGRMEKMLYLALLESLHKRIAYLKGDLITRISDVARINNLSVQTLLNKAKRQTIAAFREKGVWKIAMGEAKGQISS